jgi:5,10-methylenetetrahydromethanopterin reductase
VVDRERYAVGILNCRPSPWAGARAREAEGLGAEAAFISEDVNCRDAFALAGVLALQTDTIRLISGVVNPYTRSPTAIAMAAATLDEISGGRAALGLGRGPTALLEAQMGISPGNPVLRVRECAEVVRSLLTGQHVTYQGRYFSYAGAQLEVRPVQERIPIYLAAMGPRMLQLAGSLADGVLLNLGGSVEYVTWAVSQVRSAARAAGRNPDEVTVAAWLAAYVTDDVQTGLQQARGFLAAMLAIPGQGEILLGQSNLDASFLSDLRAHVRPYPEPGDRLAAAEHLPATVVERLALVGSADAVRARVAEYRAAGVDLPVLLPRPLRAILQK